MLDVARQSVRVIDSVDLHVRGRVPDCVAGTLFVPCSRRNKKRDFYARWHDSQADLIRIKLIPGSPGRVVADVCEIDPLAEGLLGAQADWPSLSDRGKNRDFAYITQPNHGINAANGNIWLTNLMFGAPLELDSQTLEARRVLQVVDVSPDAPRVTSTAHFAYSLDGRFAYFHQSLLLRQTDNAPVQAGPVHLVRLDLRTGALRSWLVDTPFGVDSSSVNFHSAFYFEENSRRFVGLLQTGARFETIGPIGTDVRNMGRMNCSNIWIIEVDDSRERLVAGFVPGIQELGGYALSHLCVDNKDPTGFILFANYKNSDVGDETRGENIHGSAPEAVVEHYSGMVVEAFDTGKVIRVERRNGRYSIVVFAQDYEHDENAKGHTWLPINLSLDESGAYLFCNFNGFRPRLLGKRTLDRYGPLAVRFDRARHIPQAHMRIKSIDLTPDIREGRSHIAYTLPSAMAVIGDVEAGYMCSFSPEMGLFITPLNDLSKLVCHAIGHELWTYGTTHFRPEPAHAVHMPA